MSVDTKAAETEYSSRDGVAMAEDEVSEEVLEHDAERVVQDHVLLAVASGFIPGPGVDMVAAFAVQLTMLKRLANVYDIPFREDAAKSVLSSLLGTIGGAGAAAIAAASFLKAIPLVGTVVGVAGTSLSFGAFTYAIGKVFQRHFESCGTFIDLDPRAYRDYFREMRQRGRAVARERKNEAEASTVRRRRVRTRPVSSTAEA